MEFSNEQARALLKMVMETKCGYCMDGSDLDDPVCPECGAENLREQEMAGGGK